MLKSLDKKIKKNNIFNIIGEFTSDRGSEVIPVNENKDSTKEIEIMQERLIEKKAAIIEIKKIMNPIIKLNSFKGVGFFGKIKALFSTNAKSNDAVTLMSGILGGFFVLTSIPIITTIIDANILSSIPYIGLLLIDIIISIFSVNFLYKKYCEEFILDKHNQSFFEKNIEQETLMKISVYFDEEDKEIIRSINSRYKRITVKDIINILKKKEHWIEKNEPKIKSMIQEENNRRILD